MVRGFTERRLVISCGSQELCSELMERLEEEVSPRAEIVGSIRNGKIYLKIVGFEPDVVRTVLRIREAVRMLLMRTASARRGIRVEEISRMAGVPVVPDVLVEFLKLNGVGARLSGGIIYADATVDEVVEAAKTLGEAAARMGNVRLPASLRKALLLATAVTGLSPSALLRRLEELGLLDEEGNLTVEWREAARELIESLGYGSAIGF